MKIRVALYKDSKSLFSSFIRFQQRFLQWLPQRNARFSHTEIIFCFEKDEDVIKRIDKIENIYFWKTNRRIETGRFLLFERFWLWFSSSEQDHWTRFKFIEDSKENWIYYEVEITKEQYLKALDYCIWESENAYWWLSIIFTQALKTLWFVDRESPFCSQIVLQALQQIHFFCGENAIEVNPGKLSLLLENEKSFNS